MKEIQLTQGKVALVDDDDVSLLSEHEWYALKVRKTYYAVRAGPSKTIVYMHRVLMPGYRQVDHRDGNGLNNQRENLRPATNSQNQANRRKKSGTSSQFKGVSWNKEAGKWQAQIRSDGKDTHLGRYSEEEDAARAYDEAAKRKFGEFANLNFKENQ